LIYGPAAKAKQRDAAKDAKTCGYPASVLTVSPKQPNADYRSGQSYAQRVEREHKLSLSRELVRNWSIDSDTAWNQYERQKYNDNGRQ